MVDPVACRVALFVANRTEITPNALTRFSLVLGVVAAACFAAGDLALGALMFYVSFMVDCVDGKIARLKGTGTPFGLWLDYVGDRIRVVCCAFGIAYGQYMATGRLAYVLLGAGIAILDLFRYVNAPQMKRVRQTVKTRRRAARQEELAVMRETMAVESLDAEYGVSHGSAPSASHDFGDYTPRDHEPHDHAYGPSEPFDQMAGLYDDDDHDDDREPVQEPAGRDTGPGGRNPGLTGPAGHGPTIPRQASAPADSLAFTQPIPRETFSYAPPSPAPAPHVHRAGQEGGENEAEAGTSRRVAEFLTRHRVRTHLMSGIEFHAAVFVAAPLIGPSALLPVTAGAGALLVLNEIFLVYRMWQSTRALADRPAPGAHRQDDQAHVRTDPFFTGV